MSEVKRAAAVRVEMGAAGMVVADLAAMARVVSVAAGSGPVSGEAAMDYRELQVLTGERHPEEAQVAVVARARARAAVAVAVRK